MAGIELKVEQNTPVWYKSRLGVPTASDYGKLFVGGDERKTYNKYVLQKANERITGKQPQTVRTDAIDWGHKQEPLAVKRYRMRTGHQPVECGFFLDMKLQTGASPDRLVGDDGLVQIKCPEQLAHDEVLRSKQIPYKYYWQMVGELFVTGREWNDYCSFNPDFPDNAQLMIVRMWRKDVEHEFEMLRERIEAFNTDVEREVKRIRSFVHPPVEARELVTSK